MKNAHAPTGDLKTSPESSLVSVIMCFYNPVDSYFREAIDSVRSQTYRPWELFLVDTGTSNGGDALAREYADRDPAIRYLRAPDSPHSGPAASRNHGMRQAQGEWVAFLDADDVWLPDKLEEQVNAMQSRPEARLSYGGILRWYNGAGGVPDHVEVHAPALEVQPPGALIHRWLANEVIPGMSALMLQRSAAMEVGGFEESLLWAEDQTISYKIALQYECLLLPGWKVKYRQHPQSTTAGVLSAGSLFANHVIFLDWVVSYFTQAGVKDVEAWSQLRKSAANTAGFRSNKHGGCD